MVGQLTLCKPTVNTFVLAIVLMLSGVGTNLKAATYAYTFKDLYTFALPAGYDASTIQRTVASTGIGFGFGGGPATGDHNGGTYYHHGLLWDGNGAATDLNPSSFIESAITAVDNGLQVGSGSGTTTNNHTHALLWNGTNPPTDLNPAGFIESIAHGVKDGQVVGEGATSGLRHALLWDSAGNLIDLSAEGFNSSGAWGVGGGKQVGDGTGTATNGETHALLWSGTNAVVDLNPSGFSLSSATDTDGIQQVGIGAGPATDYHTHALLWNGSNAVIDLNPARYIESGASSVRDGLKAGSGYSTYAGNGQGKFVALMWDNSNTAVNLGALLPTSFQFSYADSIDSLGNIFGHAQDNSGNWHAIEWSVVPEPSSLSLLIMGALSLRRRRPSRHAGI